MSEKLTNLIIKSGGITMASEIVAKKAMEETAKKAVKEAEKSKKQMEIQKDIAKEMDNIKFKEGIAAIQIDKGLDPVAQRVAIDQSAKKIELKNRELNRLK